MGSGLTSTSVVADWRQELAAAVRDVETLWQLLDLPQQQLPAARRASEAFPLVVTKPFLQRMRRGDPQDPLLRQVLPWSAELAEVAGYGPDPVGERDATVQPGLLRKYQGRALLITTGACAIHCRYCFRRHFPYDQRPRGKQWWQPALAALAADPSIDEVILSGGDPLVLPDSELAQLAADCARIPHLKRLRIHTRLPIMIPQRVDDSLLSWLQASPLSVVVVIHSNHPQEIDEEVLAACQRLRDHHLSVLNQAVLLRGINDEAEIQYALGMRLLQAGVLPYYLHALDPVAGAAHFAVSDARARELMDSLHRMAPGYLVPRLVREVPGEAGKRWLWPAGES